MLHANDALKVDQKLVVGAPTETVTSLPTEAQLNLENGMSEGLITGTQIRELVLNNRNYEQLLTLQPGVAYGNAPTTSCILARRFLQARPTQVAFSVNGERPTANNWTIDGADNVDRGANLTLLAYPSVDAIAEVQTLRGTYEAEYGRSASGADQRGDRVPAPTRCMAAPMSSSATTYSTRTTTSIRTHREPHGPACGTTTLASRWADR